MDMDLDLRKLRYFAAVAEHEHFGRAAEQLYIAQPVLSRQIRSLEQDLGCALLERTTRSVRLTAAGRQLQHEAADLLGEAADAARRVHQAARGSTSLVGGFAPGLSVAAAVRAYEAEQPGINKRQLLQADLADQTNLDAQVRRTTTVEEKLELVALGRGLAILPHSVA